MTVRLTAGISQSIVNMALEGETGIHQKRTLAFINHFIIRTIEFMNNFATQCETKLMDFDVKLQKVDASLRVLETKLASINELQAINIKIADKQVPVEETIKHEVVIEPKPDSQEPTMIETVDETPAEVTRDPKYDKFFKMVQFGVPIAAVKLKMSQEGLDPNALG
ncbi:coiled-coil domain containing 53 [Arctopsyche grandis]|uniref:coiled-coil domain containing 53 n=1 Tax=Arctopsyche grandis TaxID=121162 RepID=UPI00406D70DB